MSLPGCGKIRTSTSKAVQHSSLGILLTSLGFVLIPQQRAQLLLRLQATLVSGPSHPVRPAAVARSTTCRWQTPFNSYYCSGYYYDYYYGYYYHYC